MKCQLSPECALIRYFSRLINPLPPSRGFRSSRCFELRNDVMTSDASAGELRHSLHVYYLPVCQMRWRTNVVTYYALFISSHIITTI